MSLTAESSGGDRPGRDSRLCVVGGAAHFFGHLADSA